MDRRRTRRGDIEYAGIWQRVLQAQSGAALLRGALVAALGLLAGGVLHGMGLVEHDHAIEVATQPIDDLLHARRLRLALGRAQGGIGGEQDALAKPDRRALLEAG